MAERKAGSEIRMLGQLSLGSHEAATFVLIAQLDSREVLFSRNVCNPPETAANAFAVYTASKQLGTESPVLIRIEGSGDRAPRGYKVIYSDIRLARRLAPRTLPSPTVNNCHQKSGTTPDRRPKNNKLRNALIMSSWTGASQLLPRRRQRRSEASTPIFNPAAGGDHRVTSKSARKRVTSGGSVIKNGQSHIMGGDSTTGIESVLGIDLLSDKTVDDNIVTRLEDRIYERIPEVDSRDPEDLGSIPRGLSQTRIDELHERVMSQNFATMHDFENDEWMFD